MPRTDAHRPVSRRTFLKGALGGATLLALAPWRYAAADGTARDLIVVSNNGERSVTVIDPVDLEVLATLPLAGTFSFPATRWDATRDLIWSGFAESGAVDAFRLSSGERVAHVVTGSSQNYTELTPDGKAVLVSARFRDRLLKVGADPASDDFGKLLATLEQPHGSQPCDVTVDAAGHHAYLPDRGTDTLTTVDVASLTALSRVKVAPVGGRGPVEPYMATASPAGNVLFVENAVVQGASATGSESIYDLGDPAQPKELARLSRADGLGSMPLTSEITPDGRYGMVICRGSSEVSVVDIAALKVVTSVRFPAGSNPVTGTFRYGEGDPTLFVPLPGRDAVAVIAVPDFQIRRLIPVGPRPVGVVYLRAPLPDRPVAQVPLGTALAGGRTFPESCPDPCCGPV